MPWLRAWMSHYRWRRRGSLRRRPQGRVESLQFACRVTWAEFWHRRHESDMLIFPGQREDQ